MTIHNRSISTDFTSLGTNSLDVSGLEHEIGESSIGPSLIGISVTGDTVTMTFDSALSVPTETDTLTTVCNDHEGQDPAGDEPDAVVAVSIAQSETSINDANWVTAGTATLDVSRYADPYDVKVEAMGMADTTGGAADVRIAWRDEDGNSGAFGVTTIDTSGSWDVATHNRQPANIPGVPTEYRLQFRNGASSGLDVRGWVLTFIRK